MSLQSLLWYRQADRIDLTVWMVYLRLSLYHYKEIGREEKEST